MQNLQLLIRNIKHFYLTQLQQLVITGLPNITHIAHSPESGKWMPALMCDKKRNKITLLWENWDVNAR